MEMLGYALQPSLKVETLWSKTPLVGAATLNYTGTKFVVKTGRVMVDSEVKHVIMKFLLLFRVPPCVVNYSLPVHIIFHDGLDIHTHEKYYELISGYNAGWTVGMYSPWDSCSDCEWTDDDEVDDPDTIAPQQPAPQEEEDWSWLTNDWDEITRILQIDTVSDKDLTHPPEPSCDGETLFHSASHWGEPMDECCQQSDTSGTAIWDFEEGCQSTIL